MPSAAAYSTSNSTDAAREWCEDLDDWGDGTDVGNEEVLNLQQDTSNPLRNVAEISNGVCSQVEEQMKSMTIQEQEVVETIPEETKAAAVSNDTLPVDTKTTPLYEGPHYLASYIAVVEEPEAIAEDKELLKKCYESDHLSFDLTVDGLALEEGRRKKESDRHKRGRKENGLSRVGATSGGEVYEKSVAKHGDKTFQKFYKYLSKCPQQILRYIKLLFSLPHLYTTSVTV